MLCGFPLAGKSGRTISQVLFDNAEKSLGLLKKQRNELTKNIGIMNISQIPMQVNDYCANDLNYNSQEILEKLDWLRKRISQENRMDIRYQKDYSQKQEITYNLGCSFSLRLFHYISVAEIKFIYLCGLIAQNFHKKFCEGSIYPYVDQIIKISHPAKRNDNDWNNLSNKIIELKKKI